MAVGRFMYFTVKLPGADKHQLWRTIGTPNGTVQLLDGAQGGSIELIATAGAAEQQLFRVSDGDGESLWSTDGTAVGTRKLHSFPANEEGAGLIGTPARMGDRTYFLGRDDAGYNALWATDGTAAGTSVVRSLGGPIGSLSLAGPTRLAITRGVSDRYELWTDNGTGAESGFYRFPFYNNSLSPITLAKEDLISARDGSRAYFRGATLDGVEGLYVTDGTAAGTRRLTDLPTDGTGNDAITLGAAGDHGLFVIHKTSQHQLYYLDGSEGSTLRTVALDLGSDRMPVLLNNTIWFSKGEPHAATGQVEQTLYKVNLTDGAQVKVRRFEGATPPTITVDRYNLYALTHAPSSQLWRFNASDDGREVTKNLAPQLGEIYRDSADVPLAVHNGIAYFTSGDDIAGRAPAAVQLYDTDALPLNRPPQAHLGAPYILTPTQATIRLSAAASSDPNGDPLTFTWDLNGDGAFDDAAGATVTLTASQVASLVDEGESRPISVRANDGRGGTHDASTTLTRQKPHGLSAAMGRIVLPTVFVPGDRGTAQIVITNNGPDPVHGEVAIILYASSDAFYDKDDELMEPTTGSFSTKVLRLAPGGSVTLTKRLAAYLHLPTGAYHVLAQVTPRYSEGAASTFAVSNASYQLVHQFGQVGNRSNVRLLIRDPDRIAAFSYTLNGPGTGTISKDATGGTDLTLAGTSAATRLTITPFMATDNAAVIDDVTAGSPLGSINAPRMSLTGTLALPGGSRSIVMNNLLSGSDVTLGGGAGTLRFASMSGTSLSGTGAVGSIVVNGKVENATWSARGGFGTITIAGDVTNMSISAGTTTPTPAAIGRLLVSGAATKLRVSVNAPAGSSTPQPGGALRSITITGRVSDDTRFVAALLPAQATLAGQRVTSATDPRFVSQA
jgi:ELWxxDGT repeat protein